MFRFSFCRVSRRGSVLLTALFVIVVMTMLLSAIMPLTVTGYGLARADRDRASALAAAEAGLNWEIGRINNRLWDKNDSGTLSTDSSGNPTLDSWPTSDSAPPSTASTVVLETDSSGNWSQRFIVGVGGWPASSTPTSPYSVSASSWFVITAEGEVRAADGHIVKRCVQSGGASGGPSLFSLFDTAAIFAFSTASPAWTFGGSSTVTGGCGSNGAISGNGSPTITVGPLGLWGSSASYSGVTLASGVSTFTRSAAFVTDTADAAASLLYSSGASSTAYNVGSWAPTGYDSSGNATGPSDQYGRTVNSGASIWTSAGVWVRNVAANEFLDSKGYPVLDQHIKNFTGTNIMRLKPGIYYFAEINLSDNAFVEVANDYYKADGTALYDDSSGSHVAINGPASTSDYDSERNRITMFVDAITPSSGNANTYIASAIGSGLYAALQGDKSSTNSLRYRRPGNFRIYAKNTGDFSVGGSSSSSVEFNANVLHYNKDSSGNYYGSVTLNSGCHLYGGLFAWTITAKNGANVEQYGTGVFGSSDPVSVVPTGSSSSGSSGGSGGSSGSSTGGGVTGGFGGWYWSEITAG